MASQREKRTVAGLVSSSQQHPKFHRLSGARLDGLVQGVLPVVEGEDVELEAPELGLGGGDGIVAASVGNVGLELVYKALELSLVLAEEVGILRRGEGGQSGGEEGCETHRERRVAEILIKKRFI